MERQNFIESQIRAFIGITQNVMMDGPGNRVALKPGTILTVPVLTEQKKKQQTNKQTNKKQPGLHAGSVSGLQN